MFFSAGAVLGAAGVRHPLFGRDGPLARAWVGTGLSALLAFAVLVRMQLADLHGTNAWSSETSQVAEGFPFILCCVLASAGLTGLFLRHLDRTNRWLDAFVASAYGIYLVHYPVVVWMQTALLPLPRGAILKAAVVLAAVLPLSWLVVACSRQFGPVRRVL